MTIRDIAIAFGYQVDSASEKKVQNSVNSLKSFAAKALGAIGIGFSLINLKDIAEEFNGINDKIRNATEGMGEQSDIQQRILKTANDTKMSYASMADSVSKLSQNSDVFSGVEDAAQFSELVAKNFMAAGKSESEVASLMSTINTAMSRGAANSRVMLQMFRESPETVNMLARSFGVSTAQLEEMVSKGQVSAQMLKDAFVKNADGINAKFAGLDYSISDAMLNIRNQWGMFVDETNSKFGVTQTIAEFMVKGFTKFIDVLKKGRDWVENLAKRLGGMKNLLKLVAITAGSIFLALNAGKILGFLKGALRLLNPMHLKTLLIVGSLILLALLIEDFIGFMSGKDSVIGKWLEDAGIDSDEFRNRILEVWETITIKLAELWKEAKKIVKGIWNWFKEWWGKHGPGIKEDFTKILNGLVTFLEGLSEGNWQKAWDGLVEVVEGALDGIARAIDAFFPGFYKTFLKIQGGLGFLRYGFDWFADFKQENLEYLDPEEFARRAKSREEGQKKAKEIDNQREILPQNQSVENRMKAQATGQQSNNNPYEHAQKQIHYMNDNPNGKSGGNVRKYARGTNYTPDTFIAGDINGEGGELITGAKGRKVFTAEKTREIFDMINGFAKMANTAHSQAHKEQLLQTSQNSVTNCIINQNINIDNEFHGDRAGQEKSSIAMEKAADDITSWIARGLQFS